MDYAEGHACGKCRPRCVRSAEDDLCDCSGDTTEIADPFVFASEPSLILGIEAPRRGAGEVDGRRHRAGGAERRLRTADCKRLRHGRQGVAQRRTRVRGGSTDGCDGPGSRIGAYTGSGEAVGRGRADSGQRTTVAIEIDPSGGGPCRSSGPGFRRRQRPDVAVIRDVVNALGCLGDDTSRPKIVGSHQVGQAGDVVAAPTPPGDPAQVEPVVDAIIEKRAQPVLIDGVPEAKFGGDPIAEPVQQRQPVAALGCRGQPKQLDRVDSIEQRAVCRRRCVMDRAIMESRARGAIR